MPLIRLFTSLMILSRQELVENRQEQAPRMARKREGRWRPPKGYISVITLRHKKVEKETGGTGKIDYQYRWIVAGFWRRQWYPSIKRHKWKYIHEYVKGPKDKPLVVRSKRMFNFRR